MNCSCYKCIKKNKHLYELPENKELSKYPLIMKDNNSLFYPEIKDSRLICNNLNIRFIIPRTINYLHLIELNISDNNIKEIPYIQSIKILKCNNCNLQNLPLLPELEYLECSNNKICEIPNYKKLKYLNCSNNYINKISFNNLQKLICNNNMLSDINIKSLKYLEAKKCPITTIYKLPLINKRSSLILNNKLSLIYSHGQHIDEQYIVLDWYNKKINADVNRFNKFTKNILRFLFILKK
jgi:hypothetical protein